MAVTVIGGGTSPGRGHDQLGEPAGNAQGADLHASGAKQGSYASSKGLLGTSKPIVVTEPRYEFVEGSPAVDRNEVSGTLPHGRAGDRAARAFRTSVSRLAERCGRS